ncbi:hypothetical protein HKD37_05G012728 [Glycine soja]
MATMMEAMMSMKKIMEVNAAAVATVSAVSGVDPTPPFGLNLINHPTADTGNPHFVLVQNKQVFPPYGLPSNYTPPNENVNNSPPILIESQQPQSDHAHVSQPMGETHEMHHHNLADFEPCLGYATEGQAVGEYAQRWKDMAAQVAPPMTEREMITVIVDTLSVFYYEKNGGVRTFKLRGFGLHRRKDRNGSKKSEKACRIHPKIPVSYANLLPYLLDNAMVAITPARVPQPLFFRGYDLNATCAYHGGVPGHSIEHCMTLKRKVQSLIDVGWLKFEENRL